MQLSNCDVCGKDVEVKDGVLSISFKKIRDVQQQRAEWEKNHRTPLLKASELMSFPDCVPWIWHHSRCNFDGTSYDIEGTQFDTPAKALRWSIHLIEKNWFQFTGWREVIHRFFPECN